METISQKAVKIVKQYIVNNTPLERFTEDFWFEVHPIMQTKAGENWSFIYKSTLDVNKLYIIEYIAEKSIFELKVFDCVDKTTYTNLTRLRED